VEQRDLAALDPPRQGEHTRLRPFRTADADVVAEACQNPVIPRFISLLIHPDNTPSQQVANRCAFTRQGVLRAYEPFKGTRPDLISY
jgi:hypothetical protein